MKSKIMDHIDVLILGSSPGKNVLKNKTRININPPPSDDRCMCCGRHISELTPYGKIGDPLPDDFEDELLVKRFRTIVPCKKMAEKAYNQAIKLMKNSGNANDNLLDWMIKIFGKEIGEQYYYCLEGYSQVVSCWECIECSVSEGDVYLREL